MKITRDTPLTEPELMLRLHTLSMLKQVRDHGLPQYILSSFEAQMMERALWQFSMEPRVADKNVGMVMYRALKVFLLDKDIAQWLESNDPKALEQAASAVAEYEKPGPHQPTHDELIDLLHVYVYGPVNVAADDSEILAIVDRLTKYRKVGKK